MVAKAIKVDWRATEGVVIFYGENGEAKDGIAVPIAALPKLASDARRFISGLEATGQFAASHGEWRAAQLSVAQTYNVGLMPTNTGEKVALILDQGLDTELGFAIEPEHARELGVELTETGYRAAKSPITSS